MRESDVALTKTGKDGAIYEKDAEELSLRGFRRDKKKSGQQNKEYVSVFALVNSLLSLLPTLTLRCILILACESLES